MDGGGGGHVYDGRAHDDDGRPEDVVRKLVVRAPDQPHDRLVVVHVVDRQAALRGRHARDTGVHRLRQPGAVQGVARAEQTDDHGRDEDVRRDRRGPAPPVLPLAPVHGPGLPQVTVVADTMTRRIGKCSTERRPHDGEVRRPCAVEETKCRRVQHPCATDIIIYQFVDNNIIYCNVL